VSKAAEGDPRAVTIRSARPDDLAYARAVVAKEGLFLGGIEVGHDLDAPCSLLL